MLLTPFCFLAGGTEVVYCILSLTSKLYLGWFLMSYVLWQDVDAEQSLGGSTA